MKYLVPTLLMLHLGTATQVYSMESGGEVAVPPIPGADFAVTDVTPHEEMGGVPAPVDVPHDPVGDTAVPSADFAVTDVAPHEEMSEAPSAPMDVPHEPVGDTAVPSADFAVTDVAPHEEMGGVPAPIDVPQAPVIPVEEHKENVAQTLDHIEQLVEGGHIDDHSDVKQVGEALQDIHEAGVPHEHQDKFDELTTKIQVAAGEVARAGNN